MKNKNSKNKTNRNKSQNNNLLKKNNSLYKSASLNNKNLFKNNNKSKNISTYSFGNLMKKGQNTKQIRNKNLQNDLIESKSKNNSNKYLNNNNENKDIYNNLNINSLNNQKSISDYNDYNVIFKNNNNNLNSRNNFYNSNDKLYMNNEYIENSNIFKKTLDRLLSTSQNVIEKQNNILNECDILAKNVAMNDYSIQKIYKSENQFNFPNILNDYTDNINSIFSQVKKNKINYQINENLKKENTLLKNKLEMININKEDNIKLKDDEIYTLKIILVTEINHILNFLNEIGYNNIQMNKMEISDITSQKLTNFFELIIKIIKQMNELILKKESVISKMTIEKNIISDNKNENINNKSFEKLTFDYNNYNLGLNNYNFSVKNSNQRKKKFNISFRNYNNKNYYKNFDIIPNKYNIIEINNDNSNNNIESKNNLEIKNNNYKDELLEYINKEKYDLKDKDKINDIEINKNKDMSDSYFYNKEKRENNYSYDKENNKNYQIGTSILNGNINNKKDEQKINSNISNDIIN